MNFFASTKGSLFNLRHQKWFNQFARFARVTLAFTEREHQSWLKSRFRLPLTNVTFICITMARSSCYGPRIGGAIGEKEGMNSGQFMLLILKWKNYNKICIFILDTYWHPSRYFPWPKTNGLLLTEIILI